MQISLMKTLLSLSLAFGTSAPTTLMAFSQVEQEDHQFELESMKNHIRASSKVISTEQIFEFEGLQFNGRESMDKYIVENNLIQEYLTSSNLSSIIKDHQNNILENDKIYGTNFDDFVLAYRDAFGNALTSRTKALNSYTNKGLIRQKYSYDYQGWYDSPTEAKDNFVYAGGLEKSLYYQVDQRYYNLFNIADQNELKSTFLDGYNFKPSNFTRKERLYGDNQKVETSVFNNFRESWTKLNRNSATNGIEDDLNYQDYIEINSDNSVNIFGHKDLVFAINGQEQSGDSILLSNVKSNYDANYFANRKNYERTVKKVAKKKKEKWRQVTYTTKYYTKQNNSYKENKLEIYLKKGKLKKKKDVDFDFNKVSAMNNYSSFVKLYSRKLSEIKEDEKSQFLISTTAKSNRYISNPGDIPTQDVQNMYSVWFPYFVKDQLLNFNNVPYGEYNKFGVKRDQLYDINGRKGFEYSYSEGMEYYHQYLKPDLYKNYVGTDSQGNNLYRINNNFDATSEEIENYMYLAGKQDIRLMYTFTGEKNYSSIDGLALASTQAEAQEKLFQIERSILSKKYFAYDVYGNYEVSGNNEDEAIRKLQQKVDLQAKYVHKDEVKSWNNRPISFENIISDGVYVTYRTQIKNEFVYFMNHHDAYNALTGEMNGQSVTTTNIINIYLYTEKIGDRYVEHTYSDDFELESLANKLLGYVH